MCIILFLFALFAVVFSREQTVGVRGQLLCGNQPLVHATVKLWELDVWPDPDDLLQTTYTDNNGYFQVYGSQNELTTIDPVVRIYHTCNNRGIFNIPKFCQREVTYEIPPAYITSGNTVQTWYNMGTVNMQAKQPHEQSHCFG